MEADDAALRAHYELGMERERLSDGRGDLEFTRTTEIVLRRLPAAPAVVADIGGGPGRYALWLASLGYQVEHRDLMPLHVEQLEADAAGTAGIRTAVGDVRDLDLPDASVDAVLLLGPLYHLTDRAERVRALRECARIVRPGGPGVRGRDLAVGDPDRRHAQGAALPRVPGRDRSHRRDRPHRDAAPAGRRGVHVVPAPAR